MLCLAEKPRIAKPLLLPRRRPSSWRQPAHLQEQVRCFELVVRRKTDASVLRPLRLFTLLQRLLRGRACQLAQDRSLALLRLRNSILSILRCCESSCSSLAQALASTY